MVNERLSAPIHRQYGLDAGDPGRLDIFGVHPSFQLNEHNDYDRIIKKG